MATTDPIMRTWGILNRLLFWAAFIAFWILLGVLIQDALISPDQEDERPAQAVFELG